MTRRRTPLSRDVHYPGGELCRAVLTCGTLEVRCEMTESELRARAVPTYVGLLRLPRGGSLRRAYPYLCSLFRYLKSYAAERGPQTSATTTPLIMSSILSCLFRDTATVKRQGLPG